MAYGRQCSCRDTPSSALLFSSLLIAMSYCKQVIPRHYPQMPKHQSTTALVFALTFPPFTIFALIKFVRKHGSRALYQSILSSLSYSIHKSPSFPFPLLHRPSPSPPPLPSTNQPTPFVITLEIIKTPKTPGNKK